MPDGDIPLRPPREPLGNPRESGGIGFGEKYLDRIDYAGTGVRSAICRKIAQRHGGGNTARSTPGLGSAFVVSLPFRHANRK